MKVQMFVCAGLMLALTQALGCQRTATRSATASQHAATISRSVAPNPCIAALAPAAGDKTRDAAISRAQLDARSPAHDRAALERLGYLYVARARVSNDPGDYTLAEKAAGCLEARYPGRGRSARCCAVTCFISSIDSARRNSSPARSSRDEPSCWTTDCSATRSWSRDGSSEAAAAYQRMLDLKPFYQSYTRAAHFAGSRATSPARSTAMRLAIDRRQPTRSGVVRLGVDASRCLRAAGRTARRGGEGRRHGAATTSPTTRRPSRTGTHFAGRRSGRRRPLDTTPSRGAQSIRFPSINGRWPTRCASQGRLDAAAAVERELATSGARSPIRERSRSTWRRAGSAPTKALALAEDELRTRADVFTLDAHAWALAASGRIAEARERHRARRSPKAPRTPGSSCTPASFTAALGQRREARRWLRQG